MNFSCVNMVLENELWSPERVHAHSLLCGWRLKGMAKSGAVIKEIQVMKANTPVISALTVPCQLTTRYVLSIWYVQHI